MLKRALIFKVSSWKQHSPFLLTFHWPKQVTSRSWTSMILTQAQKERARIFVHGLNDYYVRLGVLK